MSYFLPLTDKITRNSSRTTTNRILEAQFGEGYRQVAADGLNSDVQHWDIAYAPLEGTQLQELESFLETVSVTQWFAWTGLGEVVEKKWRIDKDSIKREMVNTTKFKYKFTITQHFDLGEITP